MADANEPTTPARARRGTNKHPMDYTGRDQARLQAEHTDEVEADAEQMSMIQVVKPKRTGKVHDYTAEKRPRKQVEEAAAPARPKKYQVRILADIDQMTFGHEFIDEPEYDDQGNMTRLPQIGPLWTTSFKEGEEYIVDEGVYLHLVKLGYVYGAE